MPAVILSSSGGRRRLSDDLIEQCILPLLPVSSLLRFQFVSTRWRELIISPYFVLLHSRFHTSPPPPPLLCMKKIEAPTARLFDPETHSSIEVESFCRQIYHQFGYGPGRVVASCTGLVCISCHRSGKQELVVGNPLLRDWKLIPDPPCVLDDISNNSCGLVVNMGESDVTCKLVIFSRTQLGGTGFDQLFHVFTSSTGLWETIQERVVSPSYTDVWPSTRDLASVRGILYAMCKLDYLLWFDPKEKRSGYEALPPPTCAVSACFFTTFGEWNGELSYTRGMARLDGIEIWSMTDHCKPCWTKKHTLSFNTIIGNNLCFADVNMGAGRVMPFGGDNLMFWIDEMLYSYNVKTGQAHSLLTGSYSRPYCWISYQRSLVIWPNPGQMAAEWRYLEETQVCTTSTGPWAKACILSPIVALYAYFTFNK